jgi:hypothetical protein
LLVPPVCWNTIFEVEQIEKLALIAPLSPHHVTRLRRSTNQAAENHAKATITSLFQQHRSLADIEAPSRDVCFTPKRRTFVSAVI